MSGPELPGAREWRDAGEILSITFRDIDGEGFFAVGRDGVTRIEKWTKSGMHSDIAYVRVWSGDHLMAEFCQHGLTGVYFKQPEAVI